MTTVTAVKKFAQQVYDTNGMTIGDPVILEEITFIPIIKEEIPKDQRDYITLSEALEANLCKIIDKGTEIAHIIFQNVGDIPILIEEGEIFLGKGTQDRICVATVLVQPNAQVEIPVKCVHAPHHLSSGAGFTYGGKCSRAMLDDLRSLKFRSAAGQSPVSTISQHRVWDRVSNESAKEESVSDRTQYTQTIGVRRSRSKEHSDQLKFPKNTIGFIVIDQEGNIKGMEIHRSPHNFKARQEGIIASLEGNFSWEKTGKGPFQKASEKAKIFFKNLSEIQEGKDAQKQIEVEGLVINLLGISGEVLTSKFYSDICPACKSPKPRQEVCPACGSKEDVADEMAFMSFA
ncbi:MAG TPA: DUF6569 family protein [Candidatus Deferrimicrobium sp.]|nr:DUF6569 family protein [Candidatus Deferrimicrobium sp.]